MLSYTSVEVQCTVQCLKTEEDSIWLYMFILHHSLVLEHPHVVLTLLTCLWKRVRRAQRIGQRRISRRKKYSMRRANIGRYVIEAAMSVSYFVFVSSCIFAAPMIIFHIFHIPFFRSHFQVLLSSRIILLFIRTFQNNFYVYSHIHSKFL